MSGKFDWKALVGKLAPTVATALGGPLAGLATKTLAGALGLDAAQPPQDLEEQIEQHLSNASPEDLLKVKQSENDFKARMRELDIKEADLYLKDVQDARHTFGKSWEPVMVFIVLSVMVTGGLWYLLVNLDAISETKINIVLPLFGMVIAQFIAACSYFVGTTKASASKTDAMNLQISRTRAGATS